MGTITQKRFDQKHIEQWLVREISERLGLAEKDINLNEPFSHFGLDSAESVMLAENLSKVINRELDPTILWNYPTIESLSSFIKSSFEEEEQSSGSQKMNAQSEEELGQEGIAIIGIGCRFPGANNKDEFWNVLRQGVDAISKVPNERWDINEYNAHSSKAGKKITNWGGFLTNIDQFDTRFFGISPREAELMDPQQRILLEVCWEALEDAGIPMEKVNGSKTGTFIGISTNDYGRMVMNSRNGDYDLYPMTGNSFSIAANRISYVFNLRGPSIAVDTACSSSLTAVHLAFKSIVENEVEMAIAGGVNLILSPEITAGFSKAGMMAADGRCKTFDYKADGYVRGEGAGVVILKSLRKAQEDGDLIYAVIKGTAMNQDGKSNGITAPNGQSQEAVLKEAYKKARILPNQVKYVETHGTGTPLGDPIEIGALHNVLCEGRKQGEELRVGSVKTNIGHLESAAGIAGLIKVALSMANQMLPKHLHFEKANPKIPFEQYHISVQTEEEMIENIEGFVAGVSSFGFGGTNVHAVVQALPPRELSVIEKAEGSFIIPFSAHTKEQLNQLIQSYREWIVNNRNIANISYSLANRRSHFKHRAAFVADSIHSLEENLANFVPNFNKVVKKKGLVFIFSDLNEETVKLAGNLFRECNRFREVLHQCDLLIQSRSGWFLLDHIFREDFSCLSSDQTRQEMMLALQLSLVEQWKAWGIKPDKIIAFAFESIIKQFIIGTLTLEEAFTQLYVARDPLKNKPNDSWAEVQELINEGYDFLLLPGEQQYMKNHINRFNGDVHVFGLIDVDREVQLQYMEQLATLFELGYELKWDHIFTKSYEPVRLLPYPWSKERYWIEHHSKSQMDNGIKGKTFRVASLRNQMIWEAEIDMNKFQWLNDHTVMGSLVLPGSFYVEMIYESISEIYGSNINYSLKNIQFIEALILKEKKITVQVSLANINDKINYISIYSEGGGRSNEQWCLHTTGEIAFE